MVKVEEDATCIIEVSVVDVYVANIDECRLEEDDMTSVLLAPKDNGSNKSDDNKIYVEVVPIVFSNDGIGDVINANKDIISLN